MGGPSLSVLEIDCPEQAEVGEEIIGTYSVSANYSSSYAVTNIILQSGNTGEEIEDFAYGVGTFSFTMPAEDVVVLFYLGYRT